MSLLLLLPKHFSSSCIPTTTTEQGFSGKKEKKKIEFIVISFSQEFGIMKKKNHITGTFSRFPYFP
jgi:hypothetical protein